MPMEITPALIADTEAVIASAHERDVDALRERLARDRSATVAACGDGSVASGL
jgi:hypothetical protein